MSETPPNKNTGRRAGIFLGIAAASGILMVGTIGAAVHSYKKPAGTIAEAFGKVAHQARYDMIIAAEAAVGLASGLGAARALRKKP